jgi:D-3-phosphoglycerate dehydrogenase
VTPHLGASTDEAQLSVALETAEEVVDFFNSGVARNSLNFPTIDPSDMKFLGPWFALSERMGAILSNLTKKKLPLSIRMHFHGDFQGKALDPLKIGFFKGLFSAIMTDDAPNYVSAPLFAKEHGIQVYLDQEEAAKTEDYTHLMEIMTEIGETNYKLMGSVINGISNIISLQEFPIEFRLEGIVLVVQNRDIPNMVGTIGTFIGSKNINIARLELARIKKGTTAFTALSLDTPLSDTEIKELKAKEGILDVFQVNFEG